MHYSSAHQRNFGTRTPVKNQNTDQYQIELNASALLGLFPMLILALLTATATAPSGRQWQEMMRDQFLLSAFASGSSISSGSGFSFSFSFSLDVRRFIILFIKGAQTIGHCWAIRANKNTSAGRETNPPTHRSSCPKL